MYEKLNAVWGSPMLAQ